MSVDGRTLEVAHTVKAAINMKTHGHLTLTQHCVVGIYTLVRVHTQTHTRLDIKTHANTICFTFRQNTFPFTSTECDTNSAPTQVVKDLLPRWLM